MGISHRLWDDSVFVPAGEQAPEPAFVGQLLARLRLEDAPKADQVEGIRHWLETHDASKSLEISLERRGFTELLYS
ncbi:hypothetical protein SEA_PHLOP_15 [Gordonia phage Phlop]|nr:hypothetical protein BH794_gp15 [Gordonia phage Wizard]YP_010103619.1 hypothetical protein KNU68_gp15 [Gordonia phage Nubi]YP_010104230.1 hypothetical protein KNU74_gp16 [Gordonia phage Fireball]YP_010107651.1 hypothetical protein KNV01_gp15 [Gordonia phage Evamon]YP_010114934.1 hypothetical protein KNV78_gp15 [Gordonia phage Phlop]UVK62417.1 hypothetical protein SEA_SALVADOR_15 [Gordonia phage Salvador]UVK63727.1 hypothetical protein SEA_PULLUMCAVEA_15 [Gordonia phage PullumCavea]ANA8532